MSNRENTISSQCFFEGRILRLRVDKVELKGGRIGQREIVEHPGAVAIVAITQDKKVLLVTQYRKPMEKELMEIPAGKLEKNEIPLSCAQRELLEETGYVANNWQELLAVYTSPGFSNEKVVIFLATDLSRTLNTPMDTEEISHLDLLPLGEVIDLIKENKIEDAKTAAGILAAKVFYEDETT
ncbi:NUDIX hydrolase [Desulfitibacter alkalitolerans]|uniref:NUDIX hydrolase n=1 Tax=Desulfitibacter alkalitolerans TaxID=264641 RepID=UPI0005547D71|nr:NUDIX hydrolase [Desulfitibacter alkalitolerans]